MEKVVGKRTTRNIQIFFTSSACPANTLMFRGSFHAVLFPGAVLKTALSLTKKQLLLGTEVRVRGDPLDEKPQLDPLVCGQYEEATPKRL
jgi:hypothetical protein